mgnify:FL=1|jgi:hypothetical protein|tara:strand:+ start:1519 stop:1728 length:210 start_codon:yes stop_codon:yes gene_type:complete
MIYKELAELIDYDIPVIEIYNEVGELEYVLDLDTVDFDDIDIVYKNNKECFGIIKLVRDEQTELNDKEL